MGTLYSSYLGQDFETQETEAGNILTHGTLEKIVLNDAPANGKPIKYHFSEPKMFEPGHFVVFCTMTGDNDSRRVEAIGEASEASLESNIARMYPVLMATQRAFDRAAIRILDFPGKAFSDSEIETHAASPSTKQDSKPSGSEKATEKRKEAEKKPTQVRETPTQTSPAPVEKPAPKEEPAIQEKPLQEKPVASEKPTEDAPTKDDEYGVIVTMGRCKGKGYSIGQLAEVDIESLKWIAGAKARHTEDSSQIKAARKWLETHQTA